MRLIDADSLLKTTQTYDLFNALEQAKEVKAIPLDKVKQAREEIKSISQEVPYRNQAFNYEISICETDKVLKILDKLIAESET